MATSLGGAERRHAGASVHRRGFAVQWRRFVAVVPGV